MRSSFIPALLILLLLALAFLMPGRDEAGVVSGPYMLPGSAAVGPDVAAALLGLPRLELLDPPGWVVQRGGQDEVLRSLDRLSWGSHDAIRASISTLEEHPRGLAREVLSRMQALPDHDMIHLSKLVSMLAYDSEDTPGVVEELTRRGLSPNGLVSKAALRVLGQHPSSVALGAILERRDDDELDVRDAARAALVARVRNGDLEALAYMLADLEERPHDPEIRFFTALADVPTDPRVLSVLRRITEQADYAVRTEALATLAAHGDTRSIEELERMMVSDDMIARINGTHMAARSGQVLGEESWRSIVDRRERQPVLMLMAMMDLAIREGHSSAPLAVELIERMGQDPTHPAQVEALDLLFGMGHPWGVERTRNEIQTAVGPFLSQTVERIDREGGELGLEFAELAYDRLAQPDLGDIERLLLCRLLASVDPVRAADVLVGYVMEGTNSAGVLDLMSQLSQLGDQGLRRLQAEVGTNRGAGLYLLLASQVGGADSLPVIEQISMDMSLDPVVRQYALDAIVRVQGGDREGTLRRVAQVANDQQVRDRAFLLFWNYL